ncbi:potassium ion channel [Synechococcus sp. MEDNS5]|uniref:potassium channel family protein n=1 Tax=Synechococcus sp. MEDNS5 TaxID=1442554 RepID=UPI00164567F5|nr:potassium channel family protein [Synechococcus sp. MEDNS5]QNJ06548.1 potassium ion channel [Synechococcus sp. MEDNS5]
MRSEWRSKRRRERLYELLLGLCLLVLASFAFPRVTWLGSLGYALIALLLTQLVMIRKQVLSLQDRLYQALGIVALLAQLLWLLTPVRWESSGVPLVLSWSVLVGWSVIRLVERLASERRVTAGMLMGAAAGYLLLGLTAGLVMSGVETIQPGSFEPLDIPLTDAAGQNNTVLVSAPVFAQINYFAFICLTTVGFGDINPELPLARMLAVSTGIAGPLYLAVVMGVLIGRYSGDREIEERLEQHNPDRR